MGWSSGGVVLRGADVVLVRSDGGSKVVSSGTLWVR